MRLSNPIDIINLSLQPPEALKEELDITVMKIDLDEQGEYLEAIEEDEYNFFIIEARYRKKYNLV